MSLGISCSSAQVTHTHRFIVVLTGPAPLFYLKHTPNRSLAFSGISPVKPVWMSRLPLDPALNLSKKKKKKQVFVTLEFTVITADFSLTNQIKECSAM